MRILTHSSCHTQAELYRPVIELTRLEIPAINVAGDAAAAEVRLAKL